MENVLVTGAGGFVGRHLIPQLIGMHRVKGLVRRKESIPPELAEKVDWVLGDIADRIFMSTALRNVSVVYYLVHAMERPSSPAQRFHDLELNWIQSLIEQCKSQGVRKVIYLSVLGADKEAKNPYFRTRFEAEELLRHSGLDFTLFRSSIVFGPGGKSFEALVRSIERFPIVFMPGSGKTRLQPISIFDLVYYLHQALDQPTANNKTLEIGCPQPVSYLELVDILMGALGIKKKKLRVPWWIVGLVMNGIERVGRYSRGGVSGMVESLREDVTIQDYAYLNLFPWKPMPIRDAVKAALTPKFA